MFPESSISQQIQDNPSWLYVYKIRSPGSYTQTPIPSNLHSFCSRLPQIPVKVLHLPHQSFHLKPLLVPTCLRPLPSRRSIPTTSPILPYHISSMATNTLCQPSNADTNQYLFTTTRVLAAVGFSYLLKALYQLITWPLLSHRSSLNRPNGKPSLFLSLACRFQSRYRQADVLFSIT